jgi:tetratricopeptide (TPR) repeat protein
MRLKYEKFMNQKIKTKKGFTQIPALIGITVAILFLSISGYSWFEFHKTSKILEKTDQLVRDEKYSEAIKNLEIIRNKWPVKILQAKKQLIDTKLEEIKKLKEIQQLLTEANFKLQEAQSEIDNERKLSLITEAISLGIKATDLFPNNAKAWFGRGEIYFNTKQLVIVVIGAKEWAIKCYKKALELDPNAPFSQEAKEKIAQLEKENIEEKAQKEIEEERRKRIIAESQLQQERELHQQQINEFQQKREIELELAKVPSGYYQSDKFRNHNNTLEELESFLVNEFMLPRGYKVNEFDCSESAAYLEWALEDAGFNAYIAVGLAPWNPKLGYHAWVIVITNDNRSVAIESTVLTNKDFPQKGLVNLLKYLFTSKAPGIVYYNENDPVSQNYYYHYDHLYKDIYEAIRGYGSAEQWNWWEGYWGFM